MSIGWLKHRVDFNARVLNWQSTCARKALPLGMTEFGGLQNETVVTVMYTNNFQCCY